jgi:putative transposase
MARIARIIVPDCPHHITHRGNHREDIFFSPQDRDLYLSALKEHAEKFQLDILAWCLMSNHIHLVAIPENEISLAKTIGGAHRKYSRRINECRGWSGHLWANRYFSTPLDEPHLLHAIKYVELNPVRVGLVSRAEDWPWSSARSHVFRIPDPLLTSKRPFFKRKAIDNWAEWLTDDLDNNIIDLIRRNTMTGRPTGSAEFINGLELLTERVLTPQKRGRKKKGSGDYGEKR